MSDCRFGVSPVNYPDPDPESNATICRKLHRVKICDNLKLGQLIRDAGYITGLKFVEIWHVTNLAIFTGKQLLGA